MPIRQIPDAPVRYALLAFDKRGNESREDPDGGGGLYSEELLAQVKRNAPSHVFLFAHGWKGDVPAAIDQYNRWINAVVKVAPARTMEDKEFNPLWIGLHWPSLPWGEEELGTDSFDADGSEAMPAPNELVEAYLDRLDLGSEARPLLEKIVSAHRADPAATELPPDVEEAYRELADLAGRHDEGPGGPPDADGANFDPQMAFAAGNEASMGTDFGGGGGGGILDPLRQLSFWKMKRRARIIGEGGMHRFVSELMTAAPLARFHFMGHSFGCIVVTCILGGPGARQSLPRPVDSVALVQGAVSHWSFASRVPETTEAGYFNPVLGRGAIRGPVIVTRSRFDRAVGILYPIAAAAVFSKATFDLDSDDEPPPIYGGLGTYGMCGRTNVSNTRMLAKGERYGFQAGWVYNLESSKFIRKGGGASGAHSDIDGPEVAQAIWEAAQV